MKAYVALCFVASAACAHPAASPARPATHPLVAAGESAAAAGPSLVPRAPDQALGDAAERELTIASLLTERGDYEQAVAVLRELRRRHPDHGGILEDFVWACMPLPDCRGDLASVAFALTSHTDQFPADLGRRLTLVDVLEATGAEAKRRDQIAALLRDFPSVAEGWVLAAEVALAGNDVEAAAALLARAAGLEFHAADNRDRLDDARAELADAASDRRRADESKRREESRRRRSLSRQSFFLRLEDGDDF